MRKTSLAVVGLAALALGAAGCGSSNNNKDSSASTPAAPPATQTQAATTSKPAAGASTINVGATEFKFTPGTLNAKAGEVTFDLKNNGAAPHALVVEGNGIGEKKTADHHGRPDRHAEGQPQARQVPVRTARSTVIASRAWRAR